MRTRSRLPWTLCGIVALLVVAVPALAGRAASNTEPGEGPVEIFPAEYERLSSEGVRQRAEIDAYRRSSEGRAERQHSKRAHRGLGRSASVGLLHREFPGMQRFRTRPLEPPPGGRIESYLSDNVARIDPGNGQEKLLAVSQIPLRVPSGPDGREPLDLALRDGEGGLTPQSPMVPVTFPATLSDGIALGDGWIRIFFESAGEAAESPKAAEIDQKAYYHSAAEDTDFMATPVPHGLETFAQIRSVEAPETHTLRFDLPPGLTLRATPQGGAEIVEGGEQLVSILPPAALDAQEQPVPVSYDVDGSRLHIVTKHRDADAAYPILVDPVVVLGDKWAVTEDWITAPGGAWMNNTSLDTLGWKAQSYIPGKGWFYGPSGNQMYFCAGCAGKANGLWTAFYTGNCCFYPNGSFGQWIWPTWGDVYVPRAEFTYFDKYSGNDPYDYTYLQLGVYSNSLKRMVSYQTWWTRPAASSYYHAISNSNDWGHGSYPVMTLGAGVARDNVYWKNTYAYLGGAMIYLQDHSAPAVQSVWSSSSSWIVGPGGFQMHARGTDSGLGVAGFVMEVDGEPAQWRTHHCSGIGDRTDRCPGDAYSDQFDGETFAVDSSSWAAGQRTVRVSSVDVLGKWSSPVTRTVTFDPSHTPTSAAYGGTNGRIDTDTEIANAIQALTPLSSREALWHGLHPDDQQTLAAADAFVAWGEEAAVDDGDAPDGSWDVSSAEEPVADPFFPSADVIETYEDTDPAAEAAFVPVLVRITVGACFKYCDDAGRALFRGGRGGVRRVRRARPTDWRVLRPDRRWTSQATTQPGQALGRSMRRERISHPRDYAAHHIVAATSRYARKAQAILIRCGVKPNDWRNGVFLPITEAARRAGDVRPRHGRIHTLNYYHNVNEIISKNYYGYGQSTTPHSDRCKNAIAALQEIGELIAKNKFPY